MPNTFILAAVCFAAMGITALSGFWLIPMLRRLKFGQTILEIGPSWHKGKEGTPTMGGLMFVLGVTLAAGLGFALLGDVSGGYPDVRRVAAARFFAGLIMALAFMGVGLIDDYVKVSQTRNLGLTARQKLAFQFVIAAAYLAALYLAGDTSTVAVFPPFGQIRFGPLYHPLAMLGIVYMVNSVNFTDGLDGLLGSVTLFAGAGFLAVATAFALAETQVMSAALMGGCLGFLVWNHYPAKVFMGDTGSMFLGGTVCALAFSTGMPLLLAPIGIIYIAESLSVILQVISFKLTGKRIFKMSPIHHHFEMLGYSETRIVAAFSAITALGSAFAALCAFGAMGA